jgi:hypothetical protein
MSALPIYTVWKEGMGGWIKRGIKGKREEGMGLDREGG